MHATEKFLLDQLATLASDLERFARMLDGLRRLIMNELRCSDAEAELHLQSDRTWKQLRRQQAAARRSWLGFHRTLEKERKAHPPAAPAPEARATTEATPRAAQAPPPPPERVQPPMPASAPQRPEVQPRL